MVRRVATGNLQRSREQAFELAAAAVLARPNNLNLGNVRTAPGDGYLEVRLDRCIAHRSVGSAVTRSGSHDPAPAPITAVPLGEVNLPWENRRVTRPRGMFGWRRLIEIVVEGQADSSPGPGGSIFSAPTRVRVRTPSRRQELGPAPPCVIFAETHGNSTSSTSPLSGIERDEPRRNRKRIST